MPKSNQINNSQVHLFLLTDFFLVLIQRKITIDSVADFSAEHCDDIGMLMDFTHKAPKILHTWSETWKFGNLK